MGRDSLEEKKERTILNMTDEEKINERLNELINQKEKKSENEFRNNVLEFFKNKMDIVDKANVLVEEIETQARNKILNGTDTKNSEIIALYKVAAENRNDLLGAILRLLTESRKETSPININIGNDRYENVKKEDIQKISRVLDVLENMKKVSIQESGGKDILENNEEMIEEEELNTDV